MRFTIKREEFLKSLNIVSKAIPNKAPNAILLNYLLDLNDNGLFITGSNENLSIKTFVPFINNNVEIIRNYKEGKTCVNARLLTEIIRRKDAEDIIFDLIDSTVIISDSKSEYKLNSIIPDEYPDIDFELNGVEVNLESQIFNLIVSQTAFAASLKEQRQQLTAVNLEAGNGKLIATATDSARLAKKEITIPFDIEFNANVPAKFITEIDKLTEGESSISLYASNNKILFKIGNTIVSTRLISEEYPNTKNIVPRTTNYSLEVNANDLVKAIESANIFSGERENIVDLTMSEQGIEISAKSSQEGSACEKIDVFKFEGEPLKISFNSEFVTSAIKALRSDDVLFLFIGEMKPFVIKNPSDDSIVQVVTPVRTF